VLSLVGGWIGLPIIEGGNKIREFLSPVLATAGHAAAAEHGSHQVGFEITMMMVSMGIAIAGILLAWIMYLKNPALPEKLASRFSGLYQLIYNKYFVDEAYDAVIVEPIKNGSVFLWRMFDNRVIDGAVNGAADLVQWASRNVRKLETGLVQEYALGIVGGVVVIFYIIYIMP
jgi:NADH-quinone oxidoreductase subunit L